MESNDISRGTTCSPEPDSVGRNRTWKRLYWSLLILATAVLLAVVYVTARHWATPLVSGQPVSYWLENLPPEAHDGLLPDSHPLAQAGPEIIPSLISAIEKSYAARDFINAYGRRLPPFLQRYLPKQGSPAYLIRTVAAFRLGLFGPQASNAVPSLIALLKKPVNNSWYKGRIIQALGYIGPPGRGAAPVLVDSLSDKDQWIRMAAAQSLLQIGMVPAAAIPALKRNLNDTGFMAADSAVTLLVAEQSSEAHSRVKLMLTIRGDGNTQAHVAGAFAFVKDVPDDMNAILGGMLDDNDPSVRQGAAIGLARPHAEHLDKIIHVLVEGLQRGQFQIHCAQALGRIGPEAISAMPELEQARGYVLGIAARDACAKMSAPLENQVHAIVQTQASRTETNRSISAPGVPR